MYFTSDLSNVDGVHPESFVIKFCISVQVLRSHVKEGVPVPKVCNYFFGNLGVFSRHFPLIRE